MTFGKRLDGEPLARHRSDGHIVDHAAIGTDIQDLADLAAVAGRVSRLIGAAVDGVVLPPLVANTISTTDCWNPGTRLLG